MSRLFGVFVASALAFAAMTVSAMADGMGGSIKDAPPAPEVYQWNGLSLAVGIGAGRTDTSVSVDAHKQAEKQHCHFHYGYYDCSAYSNNWYTVAGPWSKNIASVFEEDDWKGFGTLQVAYDRLIHDRILIGAFADIDFYIDGESAFSEKYYHGSAQIDGNFDLNNVWSVGGKLGFLVTPRVLLFGVGGYTEARIDASASASFKWDGLPVHTVSMDFPDELRGWFVGGGAELKLRKDVSLRLEYRYSHFGSESVSASGHFVDGPWTIYGGDVKSRIVTDVNSHADLDMDIHSVRAALVLKLGDVHDRPVESLK